MWTKLSAAWASNSSEMKNACLLMAPALNSYMILDQLPDVKALAASENWQMLDELWRDLAQTVEKAPPDPHTVAILHEREAEYQLNPNAVRPWAEVRARLAAHKMARKIGS
jgi:hypothetical protein